MKVHEPLPHQERSAERSGSICVPEQFLGVSMCNMFALRSQPCSTVIWPHWHQFYHCCHVGGAVWVLGGQHICTALPKLQAQYLQAGKVLPVWLSHVQCDMIKEDTKLSIRQQIAGDHNAMQHSCSSLRLSEIGNRIWDELNASGNVEEKEALLLALRKAAKLDKSACPVCTDVIAIDSTLLACPLYCHYLLLCRMQYSKRGNL